MVKKNVSPPRHRRGCTLCLSAVRGTHLIKYFAGTLRDSVPNCPLVEEILAAHGDVGGEGSGADADDGDRGYVNADFYSDEFAADRC